MDEVDKVFESATLSRAIVCPEWFVWRFRAINREDAEEKLQPPGRFKERVALKIKDDITARPWWQSCEATSAFDRELSPANHP